MKVAIIAIAKNENLYINEWLNYHFNMGFDNIIVCDNDDELIIKDVVNDNRVFIEDFTGIYGVQQDAYHKTLKKYKDQFDWILFIDIDEFLVLEKHTNVKDFLSEFDDEVQCVKICWKHFTDNEELDVIDGNYNVFDRFKTEIDKPYILSNLTKQFVKTTIDDDVVNKVSQHTIYDSSVITVNAIGEKIHNTQSLREVLYKGAWLNHYKTKTIGEFIRQKFFRGGPNRNNIKYRSLHYFFETNTKTQEKIDYAKKLIAELEKERDKEKSLT